MPEPLIPAEWANGLMEMVRNSDWSNWSDRDRKVEIIQVLVKPNLNKNFQKHPVHLFKGHPSLLFWLFMRY